jgi:hypothetical protein
MPLRDSGRRRMRLGDHRSSRISKDHYFMNIAIEGRAIISRSSIPPLSEILQLVDSKNHAESS